MVPSLLSLSEGSYIFQPVFFKNSCVSYTNILHFEQTFFLTLNLNSYWKYTVKGQKLKDRVWKKKTKLSFKRKWNLKVMRLYFKELA